MHAHTCLQVYSVLLDSVLSDYFYIEYGVSVSAIIIIFSFRDLTYVHFSFNLGEVTTRYFGNKLLHKIK